MFIVFKSYLEIGWYQVTYFQSYIFHFYHNCRRDFRRGGFCWITLYFATSHSAYRAYNLCSQNKDACMEN